MDHREWEITVERLTLLDLLRKFFSGNLAIMMSESSCYEILWDRCKLPTKAPCGREVDVYIYLKWLLDQEGRVDAVLQREPYGQNASTYFIYFTKKNEVRYFYFHWNAPTKPKISHYRFALSCYHVDEGWNPYHEYEIEYYKTKGTITVIDDAKSQFPDETKAKEQIDFHITIKNIGDIGGTGFLDLYVDNQFVKQYRDYLRANEEKTFDITLKINTPGIHKIKVVTYGQDET